MSVHENASAFYGNESWHPVVRIRRIKIHPDVFRAYVDLHAAALIMVEKMNEVLDHAEHQMIMREGKDLGYTMPDVDGVRIQNNLLHSFLLAVDPCVGAFRKPDGMIEFPAMTARHLHMIAFQAAVVVDDVCRNIRESDYMLWIRTLRSMDVPYIGPTSLQELFNVWAGLNISMVTQASYAPEQKKRLPSNWLQLVA